MESGAMLIHRILARIQQKTKQLTDYADAVVLGISIPRADLRGEGTVRSECLWLDLKALAGSVDPSAHETAHAQRCDDLTLGCRTDACTGWYETGQRGAGRAVKTTTGVSPCTDPHPESGCRYPP